jgi:hypothetical protein
MGGPPVVLYLITRVREVGPFRATLIAYFLPGNILTIIGLLAVGLVTGDVLLLCAAAAPAVALGLVAGTAFRQRIPAERFRIFVLGLLAVTSTVVVASVLF